MIINLPSTDPIWLEPLVNFLAVLLGAGLTWKVTAHFEKKKEREENLKSAYSLFFKCIEFTERVLKLKEILDDAEARRPTHVHIRDTWNYIGEVAGFGQAPERITGHELAILAARGESEFVTKIQELQAGHTIVFDTYERIQKNRAIVRPIIRVVARNGDTITAEVDVEQMRQLTPEIVAMETGMEALLAMIKDIASEAQNVTGALGAKLKQHYGFANTVIYNPKPVSAETGGGSTP